MENRKDVSLRVCSTINWAILFLRITLSAIILLHNISKLQEYNQTISMYDSMWGIGGALWFLLIASIEVGCALLLAMGLWVRFAAGVLLGGTVAIIAAYFYNMEQIQIELQGLYSLIYLFLLIAGGGLYSIDSLMWRRVKK